jgi:hypothetical protein
VTRVEANGLIRFAAPLIRRGVQRQADHEFERLKSLLEDGDDANP